MALNILVVDDSPTVRAILTKSFRMADIELGQVHEACHGREALEILGKNWVDLVFTDINMPEMNGIELIDQMNEDGMLNSIPVVIVSTEGSVTRIEQLKAKGVSAYLRKPFTPEAIREIIEDVTGGNGS